MSSKTTLRQTAVYAYECVNKPNGRYVYLHGGKKENS